MTNTFDDFSTFDMVEVGPAEGSPIVDLLVEFGQVAQLETWTPGVADDYGNETEGYTDGGDWPCRLWQTTGTELGPDRDTQVGSYQLAVPPECPITGKDRVTVDGVLYAVDGPPLHRRTPDGPSHITATLKAVSE
jgi:hypothetical protein